jgi:hypothetical protein
MVRLTAPADIASFGIYPATDVAPQASVVGILLIPVAYGVVLLALAVRAHFQRPVTGESG